MEKLALVAGLELQPRFLSYIDCSFDLPSVIILLFKLELGWHWGIRETACA